MDSLNQFNMDPFENSLIILDLVDRPAQLSTYKYKRPSRMVHPAPEEIEQKYNNTWLHSSIY